MGLGGYAPIRLRLDRLVAGLVLLLLADTAQAQRSEGGDFGASDQSLRGGTLSPAGGPYWAPPPSTAPAPVVKPPSKPPQKPAAGKNVPPDDAAPGDDADPTRPTALLPPPQSYMSSAWNFWPHAWAYVPSLWSAWYRDFSVQSRPTAASEPKSPESPSAGGTSGPDPGAPVLVPPMPKLADMELQKLPPPTLIRRRRYNLVIGGVGLLAATWAADRLLARDLSPKPETWVPLVGPWFLLGEQTSLAAPNVQVEVLLVADGLLQAAGLTMAMLGFVLTTKRYQVTVQPARELTPQPAP